MYFLFGAIVSFFLFFNFLFKSLFISDPSSDHGFIVAHILAFKSGAFIVFPTYFEYISYCEGFMVAEFPWLNSIIGGELANGSDVSALPFKFFYVNMNISSTYLFALAVILFIGLIGFGIIKCCKCKSDSL